MEKFTIVLSEDLKVFITGLEQNKLDFCNIITNRLDTNAVLLNSKESALIAIILKDVLSILMRIVDPEKQALYIKEIIKSLKKIENPFDIDCYMNLYEDFSKKTVEFFSAPGEEYTKNLDFTEYVVKYCIDFLNEELKNDDLNLRINFIFMGIANEITRVLRTHGFSKKTLLLKLNLEFFMRLYDYYRYAILNDIENKQKRWEKNFKEYIALLSKNLSEYLTLDEKKYILISLEFVLAISKEWRLMYIRFMEIIPKISQEQKRNLELPEDSKKILKDLISKGIQSEVKGEDE